MPTKTRKPRLSKKKLVKINKQVQDSVGTIVATVSEKSFTKNEIVQELIRSPHGDLSKYVPVGLKAAVTEPEFFAHLIAWNRIKGEIRDSKVALPVIQLASGSRAHGEFCENAFAHMAALDPRNFLRSLRFARNLKTPGHSRKIAKLVESYLRTREKNFGKWERNALQHRESMKELYALYHVKPAALADQILFKGQYPKGSVFDIVSNLSSMTPSEAAGYIIERRIPFLIAAGALGSKMKEPDTLMAIIGRMSPTELVTNMKRLEKLGVKNIPACRAALEEALAKAATSKKNTLKTTVASEAVEDEGLREKLKALQEKQIDTRKKSIGVDGDWLVCGDKSGSMHNAIKAAVSVASTLTSMVKGKVHLIFFDDGPRYIDVTGMSYEQLAEKTKHVRAGGQTNMGSCLQYLIDSKIHVDGIAMISDGGENGSPTFGNRYKAYVTAMENEPTVYYYHVGVGGQLWGKNLRDQQINVTDFELTDKAFDYYSLPGLVQTMRVSRYSLVDEIMDTRLLKLADVLA